MKKIKTGFLSFFIFLIGIQTIQAQNGKAATVKGPEKGSLVIVGGGRLSSNIIEKFIELAGGKDAPIVVIPTAAGRDSYDENSANFLKRHGATNVTVLHTADPKEANTSAFVAPLKNAKGVWFGGGRQWRLVDSYKNTEAEKLFWEVLNRGGVIGGSSAGASIQGSYLARGDTKNNQIMMGDHEVGFGFLKNVAIDQHVLARNRQFDLFTILKKKPELLGIGIDENTAVIVQNDKFEVLGASYVLMYDNSFWSREGSNLKNLPEEKAQFYFLRSGDKYDLKKRKVIN
ncbi:cyanophycinase [Flavobacteriaceae bacterium R38]|nr:cyanophycinase [Flavobacteriaceae bacterium R38]